MKREERKMNEVLILNFILAELVYHNTLLNCINLGFSKNKDLTLKNKLYLESEKYVKEIMKKKKIKQW